MTDAILVLVTAPSEDMAAEIARTLVEEELAACGNIVPGLRSIFRWEGKVSDEGESLLILKSTAALFERLRARTVELHPYECPEVIQIAIDAAHAPYLKWIRDSVRSS